MMELDDDWGAGERRHLRDAPIEEPVRESVRQATSAALRAHGLLRTQRSGRQAALFAGAAAAMLALVFAAGFTIGNGRGVQRGHAMALAAFETRSNASEEEIALLVQRTGSVYVRALAALNAERTATDHNHQSSQVADAAVNITEAALIELAPLLNEPELRVRLADRLGSGPAAPTGQTTRWY